MNYSGLRGELKNYSVAVDRPYVAISPNIDILNIQMNGF